MTETNRGGGKEKEKRKRALKSDRGTSSPRLIFQLFLPNVSVILQWTILYEGIHNDHKTSELLKRKVGRHRHSFFPAVRLAVYGFACCTESCIEDVHLSELFSHQYTKSKSNTTHDDNCCSVYLMTSSINRHQQIEMYHARFYTPKINSQMKISLHLISQSTWVAVYNLLLTGAKAVLFAPLGSPSNAPVQRHAMPCGHWSLISPFSCSASTRRGF